MPKTTEDIVFSYQSKHQAHWDVEPDHLGRFIQTARRRAGLKQSEVARSAGLDVATLSRVENNHYLPGIRTLCAIMGAVGGRLTIQLTKDLSTGITQDTSTEDHH